MTILSETALRKRPGKKPNKRLKKPNKEKKERVLPRRRQEIKAQQPVNDDCVSLLAVEVEEGGREIVFSDKES